jgi:hypothetical protein
VFFDTSDTSLVVEADAKTGTVLHSMTLNIGIYIRRLQSQGKDLCRVDSGKVGGDRRGWI